MDRDCSHEIKRCLLLGRKAMTNLGSILKSRDSALPTKVHIVKVMVFPWLKSIYAVTQSCLILCDSMDCSMPVFPVLHHLPQLAQTHVHTLSDVIYHLVLCRPLLLLPSIFPTIKISFNELALRIRWPNIGASASASVLLMNIQDWFPLDLTCSISLQSKGLLRVFSNTTHTVQKHQFFIAQLTL